MFGWFLKLNYFQVSQPVHSLLVSVKFLSSMCTISFLLDFWDHWCTTSVRLGVVSLPNHYVSFMLRSHVVLTADVRPLQHRGQLRTHIITLYYHRSAAFCEMLKCHLSFGTCLTHPWQQEQKNEAQRSKPNYNSQQQTLINALINAAKNLVRVSSTASKTQCVTFSDP